MFTLYQPFLLQAITSVHAGSGSEIGNVDLPIQREKHTGHPKFESSSLKGALRHHLEPAVAKDPQAQADFAVVFGSAPQDKGSNESQASAVSFLDARLLLFPIRSLKGTFVWITCPFVLERFNREMRLMHPAGGGEVIALPLDEVTAGTVSHDTPVIKGKDAKAESVAEGISLISEKIVLEEYTFAVKVCENTASLALQLQKWLQDESPVAISERLVVLSDDEFTHFVQVSTEVNARIRVEDNGTVDGGLWYEENVPPEAVFYSAVLIGQARSPQKPKTAKSQPAVAEQESLLQNAEHIQDYIRKYFPPVFQLGGAHTIGKGLLRSVWLKGGEQTDEQ